MLCATVSHDRAIVGFPVDPRGVSHSGLQGHVQKRVVGCGLDFLVEEDVRVGVEVVVVPLLRPGHASQLRAYLMLCAGGEPPGVPRAGLEPVDIDFEFDHVVHARALVAHRVSHQVDVPLLEILSARYFTDTQQ